MVMFRKLTRCPLIMEDDVRAMLNLLSEKQLNDMDEKDSTTIKSTFIIPGSHTLKFLMTIVGGTDSDVWKERHKRIRKLIGTKSLVESRLVERKPDEVCSYCIEVRIRSINMLLLSQVGKELNKVNKEIKRVR